MYTQTIQCSEAFAFFKFENTKLLKRAETFRAVESINPPKSMQPTWQNYLTMLSVEANEAWFHAQLK